jgi:SprB repeat
MKKIYIVLFFLICNNFSVFAQGQVRIQVYLQEAYNPRDDREESVIKVYTATPDNPANWRCANNRFGCDGCLGGPLGLQRWTNLRTQRNEPESNLIFNLPNNSNNVVWSSFPDYFNLQMEAWADFGRGSTCINNGGDGDPGAKYFKVLMSKIPPGKWQPIRIRDPYYNAEDAFPPDAPLYDLRFSVRYVVQPDAIVSQAQLGRLCTGSTTRLTTGVSTLPAAVRALDSDLKYVWEYQAVGDSISNPAWMQCFSQCSALPNPDPINPTPSVPIPEQPPVDCFEQCSYIPQKIAVWRTLAVTDTNFVDFNPLTQIFNGSLSTVRNVTFQVRTQTGTGQAYDPVLDSPTSPLTSIDFLPPPPAVTGTPVTQPSCPRRFNPAGTGTISVSGITSATGNYRWVLRNFGNTAPCDPVTTNDAACFGTGNAGIVTGNAPLTINSVPPGRYSLLIANEGGDQGLCYNTSFSPLLDIVVDSLPDITIQNRVITPPVCNGDKGLLQASFGVSHARYPPGTVTYILSNASGVELQRKIHPDNTFAGLDAGIYQIQVQNGCQTTLPQRDTLRQPARVSVVAGSLNSPAALTCNTPASGFVQFRVSASTGVLDLAPTSFTYELLRDGTPFRTVTVADPQYTFTSLPESSYTLKVKGAGQPDCNGSTETFTIAPAPALPALAAGQVQVSPVSCFGAADGSLLISGAGGFRYRLVRTADNRIIYDSTATQIPDLAAGSYQLFLLRPDRACQDASAPLDLTLTQPAQIVLSYTTEPVRCFEEQNGKIRVTATGGSGRFRFRWLRKNNNGTFDQFNADSLRLFAGTYKLSAEDLASGGSCRVETPEIVISEPALLRTTKVVFRDIQCSTDKGSLDITATGGTQPYTPEYTLNNGTTYTAFDRNTPLEPGVYQIRVRDGNGCTTPLYPTAYTVSAPPPAPLAFTLALSVFNGFNIPCRGEDNGYVLVRASGGNGAGFSGYEYTLNGNTWVALTDTVKGLTAGSRTLTVRDGRGCRVARTFTMTEPPTGLTLELVSKTDVVCFGDSSGVVVVRAAGGTGTFQYRINGGSYQSSSRFERLTSLPYTLTVRDANGCTALLPVEINSLNPPIRVDTVITPVSCRGGADGNISVSFSGGQPPYTYEWRGTNSPGNQPLVAAAGTYTLLVRDAAGCGRLLRLTISEPEALTLTLRTKPVCSGKTVGEVEITAKGGNPPYQYSADNGQTFSASPLFNTLAAGTYPMVVRDRKDCRQSATATVVQRNDRPQPGFLVASRQNALDTLVLQDISLPTPDSVQWVFPAGARVYGGDRFTRQVRFEQEGAYPVQMTAFFSGCDYVLTKEVRIDPYDPTTGPSNPPAYRTILKAVVSPNPNNGTFELEVELLKKQPLRAVIYDVLGNRRWEKRWDRMQNIAESVTIPEVAAGFYILHLITSNDARQIRIVTNK